MGHEQEVQAFREDVDRKDTGRKESEERTRVAEDDEDVIEEGVDQHNDDSSKSVVDEKDDEYHEWHQNAMTLYIALFATFGEVFRVFIGRFFGSDCSQGRDDAPDDYLSPFFVKICVTNSGTTEQTGGALFLDLPANMIGCFLMGLISKTDSTHTLPWFHPQHPLQKHEALRIGLSTGFCGCLTTCEYYVCGRAVVVSMVSFPLLKSYLSQSLRGTLKWFECWMGQALYSVHKSSRLCVVT